MHKMCLFIISSISSDLPYWGLLTTITPFLLMLPSLPHCLSDALEGGHRAMTDLEMRSITYRLTIRLDNLFSTSFPYSMGIYQTPVARDTFNASVSQLFISFYPPLLRSATYVFFSDPSLARSSTKTRRLTWRSQLIRVKKFLVGFEMFAENQRDITPESAASRLKELSEVHYREEVLS